MTKNNSKNWLQIEEEFRERFQERHIWGDEVPLLYYMKFEDVDRILSFFKPYFQEKMHEISLRELEEEHPLYKKEYNELPEIVDNNLKE